MATTFVIADNHSCSELIAMVLINVLNMISIYLFKLVYRFWTISVKKVFEMVPQEKILWIWIRGLRNHSNSALWLMTRLLNLVVDQSREGLAVWAGAHPVSISAVIDRNFNETIQIKILVGLLFNLFCCNFIFKWSSFRLKLQKQKILENSNIFQMITVCLSFRLLL